MKHFTLGALLFVLTIAACQDSNTENKASATSSEIKIEKQAESATDQSNFTTVQWIDSAKQIGKINEGQKLVVSFKFKNTGDKPLVIQSVTSSCGCTVAEKPERPIAPGAEGEIKGEFDSNGRAGAVHKNIMVTANTLGSQFHSLTFEGEVIAAKK